MIRGAHILHITKDKLLLVRFGEYPFEKKMRHPKISTRARRFSSDEINFFNSSYILYIDNTNTLATISLYRYKSNIVMHILKCTT